ncbi:MAG: metal/formaldehyde-sensitive transcriptional repressor [Burkholderiaceae bacterium]
MSHLNAATDDLVKRLHRILGQVRAIERALASGADCAKTLHLVAAARGAMRGLMDQILAAHLHEHVARPGLSDAERSKGVADLLTVLRRHAR